MIAKFKKTTHPRWAGAMLLLAALACIVLTNAYVAKADFIFGIPINLGPMVNSSRGDGTPSISIDGLSLYFNSDRTDGYGDYDIWVTTRESTRNPWGEAVNLGPNINTPYGEGGPIISADGLSLYFGSNRPGGYGDFDIYVTTRTTTDDPWGTPVNLGPNVNSLAWDGPGNSIDGLTLFLDSARPGGSGGQDLWFATRPTIDDPWGEPVNLGSKINSSGFDGSAFISPDGLRLFFMSGRSGGYGSFDAWVTTRATMEDEWDTPINLGAPINTTALDGTVIFSADGSTLYFMSGQAGGYGSHDLWQVSILPVVDLNGDGRVDFKDFRKLAQYWGQNEPSCDIAPLPLGDGIVDEKDMNLLAEHLLKEIQPVAHWRLDETQGDIAYDAIGEKDGSLNGAPLWRPVGGKAGGSLHFDGVDDYVGTPFILDPASGSFSVLAWIKGGGPGQVIMSQADTPKGPAVLSGSTWLGAEPSSGRLMTGLMDPPFASLASESVVTDGQWHHVGLVYDFSAMHRHLYVDGAQVAADTDYVGGVDCSAGLYIGAGQSLDPATFFSGLIDDVRIYDEVLSTEEVAELAR